MEIFDRIAEAVRFGRDDEIAKLADEVIAQGIDPSEAIQKGGVRGLDQLGQAFENLEVFLPELMVGGEAMKVLIDKLTPHLGDGKSAFEGKVVIGTAKGDLHDIGKNLVASTLSVNGFNVVDLGVDVSPTAFIEKAQEHGADIIAMSSLLTTSAYYLEEVINRLAEDGLRDKFKVIVGGGPIRPEFAEKIGADGYARTSAGAVRVCKQLMNSNGAGAIIVAD